MDGSGWDDGIAEEVKRTEGIIAHGDPDGGEAGSKRLGE
jgi:hypothetical protein